MSKPHKIRVPGFKNAKPPPKMTPQLMAALELSAKYGWKIFPARIERADDKWKKWSWLSKEHALSKQNWGMTDDLDLLVKNFHKAMGRDKNNVGVGVGIPTGSVNKLFIVETDTRKGGHEFDGAAGLEQLEAQHGALPDTLVAKSPSNSRHRYYKAPEGVTIKKSVGELAPGVDVLGEGAMAIAPPSVRGDGKYRWLNDLPIADPPGWLIALVREDRDDEAANKTNGSGNGHADAWEDVYRDQSDYPEPTVDELMECTRIAENPDLHFDDWADVAISIHSAFPNEDGFTAFDLFSQKSRKYEKRRTRQKWKEVCGCPGDGRITIGTYFGLGKLVDPDWLTRMRAAKRAQAAASTPQSTQPWPVMDAAAYHGVAGEVVKLYAPHTEADPNAMLMHFLAFFGNMIDRSAFQWIDGKRHHSNIFVLIVGDTAISRKGTAEARIREFIRCVELSAREESEAVQQARAEGKNVIVVDETPWSGQCLKGGLSSGEGLIWHIRDEVRGNRKGEDVIIVEGVDDKRLLLVEPEFGAVLTVIDREKNTLSHVLRQAWDGNTLQTLVKNNPNRCTAPHVTLVGHITCEELRHLLDAISAANGFANRFLITCARRVQELPFGSSPDADAVAAIAKQVFAVYDRAAHHGSRELVMDEKAKAFWASIYHDLTTPKPGLFGFITQRSDAQTKRLAAIYALLDGSDEIRIEHLKAGRAVTKFCENSARYIFGDAVGEKTADQIQIALRRADDRSMSRTDIYNMFGRNISSDKIAAALNLLERLGRVRCEKRVPKVGRPTEFWVAV